MTHQCHYPHVPECRHLITGAFIFKTDDYPDRDPHDDSLCGYCASLRACEARIMSTGAGAAADIEFGRQEGLREARNAVAALPHEDGCCSKGCACQTWDKQEPCDLSCNCSFWWMPHALAAIDALKGEQA